MQNFNHRGELINPRTESCRKNPQIEDDQRCYIENQTGTKFLFHHSKSRQKICIDSLLSHQIRFIYWTPITSTSQLSTRQKSILESSNDPASQQGEKNLVAISRIIIFQLLIITIIKKIIIVSKYFSFLFEMLLFLIYGVHSMMIALIGFWYRQSSYSESYSMT